MHTGYAEILRDRSIRPSDTAYAELMAQTIPPSLVSLAWHALRGTTPEPEYWDEPGAFGMLVPGTIKFPRGGPTRPWPGIYKGAIREGRTQPLSYRKPKTVELPESSSELEDLLKQLGGKYTGIKRQ